MISLHPPISFIPCVVSMKLSILARMSLLPIFRNIRLISIKIWKRKPTLLSPNSILIPKTFSKAKLHLMAS